MARKTLDDALNDLLKDYKNSISKAVEYASSKATEDIWKHSLTCLEEYYDNYEPNSYIRSDNLWRAFLPYEDIKYDGDEIVSVVGVEYDSTLLNMYNGSKNYSPTDGDWILDNYLKGIHPGTNGGHTTEETIYDPSLYGQIDEISPTQKMQEYLNNYIKTFDRNVLISFIKQMRG